MSIEEIIETVKRLKNEKNFEEALFVMIELFEKEPLSEEVKKALIDVLMEYGADLNDDLVQDFDNALICFNKILKIDPENYKAYYNIGITYFNLGRVEKALDSYKKALKKNPNDKFSYYNLGYTYENIGDFRNAVKFYGKSLDIDPTFIYAVHGKADAERKMELLKSTHLATMDYGKLSSLLRVSRSVRIELIQDLLKVKRNDLDIIIEWCENYGFEIDGDFLILNKEKLPELLASFSK